MSYHASEIFYRGLTIFFLNCVSWIPRRCNPLQQFFSMLNLVLYHLRSLQNLATHSRFVLNKTLFILNWVKKIKMKNIYCIIKIEYKVHYTYDTKYIYIYIISSNPIIVIHRLSVKIIKFFFIYSKHNSCIYRLKHLI